MLQELKLMTTFHGATPSALWRHQVAGPTSPAWGRGATALQLLRKGTEENLTQDGRVWELYRVCDEQRPQRFQTQAILPPPFTLSSFCVQGPSSSIFKPRGLGQKHKKKKSSASYDEKDKQKTNPNSPYFSHFWLHCVFIPFILSAIKSFSVSFAVIIFRNKAQVRQN